MKKPKQKSSKRKTKHVIKRQKTRRAPSRRSKPVKRKTKTKQKVAKPVQKLARIGRIGKSKTRKSHRKGNARRNAAQTKSRRNARTSGYGSKIEVHSSRFASSVLIIRKELTLAKNKRIKVRFGKDNSREIFDILNPKGLKYFKSIGKSKDDLFLIKIKYDFKIDKKYRAQYFSGISAKLKKPENFSDYLMMTIELFLNQLRNYTSAGFSDIRVSGLQVQGYKNTKTPRKK